MIHVGDITKLHGEDIEPVDVITFGSPCQDLSAAGQRAGLYGEKSSLFLDAVRVISEMRRATNGRYPRYAIWENVPGAFSSNAGSDFRDVLEKLAQIKAPDASVPRPPRNKWPTAGCILGTGWSLAWRVCDAQFWGVPQRRRRIALIADFAGRSASEILFEPKGMCESAAANGTAGQEIACTSRGSTTQDVGPLTMKMRCGHGKGGHGPLSQINKSATLTTRQEQLLIQPVTGTLCAGDSAGVSNQYVRQGKCIITPNLQLRRLTPLEYERLQGFPDYWTLIEPSKIGNRRVAGSDCARYKALGNSIALPPWRWILKRVSAFLPTDATLGSLFDGIGGFPLLWEENHPAGSARWASEIEAFSIAVTEQQINKKLPIS